MALKVKHQDTSFGIGDKVKVIQKFREGEKERRQAFEGIVIAIKGRESGRTFTVRRVGTGQIGIERIFVLNSPSLEEVRVVKKGGPGIRRAKLYYLRKKSKKEIDTIFLKAGKRTKSKKASK